MFELCILILEYKFRNVVKRSNKMGLLLNTFKILSRNQYTEKKTQL